MGYPNPEYLHLEPDELLEKILSVNVSSLVNVTKCVVPVMLDGYASKKERSLILNIGSFSFIGAPLLGGLFQNNIFNFLNLKHLNLEYLNLCY